MNLKTSIIGSVFAFILSVISVSSALPIYCEAPYWVHGITIMNEVDGKTFCKLTLTNAGPTGTIISKTYAFDLSSSAGSILYAELAQAKKAGTQINVCFQGTIDVWVTGTNGEPTLQNLSKLVSINRTN